MYIPNIIETNRILLIVCAILLMLLSIPVGNYEIEHDTKTNFRFVPFVLGSILLIFTVWFGF